MTTSVAARFAAKHSVTDSGCWQWSAGKSKSGYGVFSIKHRQYLAHRVAYELHVGPIPEGKQLDHLCRNRACVNPKHLEPVTGQVNTLRGATLPAANAAKTHCPKNHPYDERNTLRKRGRRYCRTCWNDYQRRSHAAKRGVA